MLRFECFIGLDCAPLACISCLGLYEPNTLNCTRQNVRVLNTTLFSEGSVLRALTKKQELFVSLVASGLNLSAAYRLAYAGRAHDSTVRVEASRLARTPKVAEVLRARIQKLQQNSTGISSHQRSSNSHCGDVLRFLRSAEKALRLLKI
jgi:hypothetical protein